MRRVTGRFLTVLLAAVLVLSSGTAAAAPGASGKPGGAGELLDEFVAAFNSGDVERMLAFYSRRGSTKFRDRNSEERDRRMYAMLREKHGDLDVQRVRIEDGEAVMVAEGEACDCLLTFRFHLEEGAAGDGGAKLSGFSVELGDTDRGGAGLPTFDKGDASGRKEVAARLDGYLKGLAEKGLFSGTVLVAREGEPVFQGAYGMANREERIPNRMSTLFDVGSITKTFTKTAIARLAQEGKLKLTDTIGDWIPDYPNREAARKVRIEHLAAHTSGLGDIFNEKWASTPKDGMRAPRDFFPIFAAEDLLFAPGEREMYSNAGYIVLGAIVEAASGMPYEEYVRKVVFEPAGMSRSGFLPRDGSREDVAVGYTTHGPGGGSGSPRRNTGLLPIRGCPAGSSSSTAMDLVRFDRALRGRRLLDPAWTEWFFTGTLPDGSGGTFSFELPIAIAGGAGGVNALMESGNGEAVVVLSNLDPPVAMEVGRQIRRIQEFRTE